MFVLAIVEDKIIIQPGQFGRKRIESLREQIEIKYSNKVLLTVGLCICIFDFLEIGDPYIYPGEGSSIQTVQFRLVVFRPYVGEILVGKISSSNKEGVRISLGFYDDIFVPATLLQNNSVFNSQAGVWVWTWEGNEMTMDIGEEIRFRTRTINFTEVSTSAKGVTATTTSESHETKVVKTENKMNKNGEIEVPPTVRRRSSSFSLQTDDKVPAAMQIIGCANDFGLGLSSWW